MQARRRRVVAALAGLFALPAAAATNQDSLKEIDAAFSKEFRASRTARRAFDPVLGLELCDRCLALAAETEDPDAAVEALTRVFSIAPAVATEEAYELWRAAADRLVLEYLDDPALVRAVFALQDGPPDLEEDRVAYVKQIAAETTAPEVKGAFQFAAAERLMDQFEQGELEADQRAELLELLRTIQSEHADVVHPFQRAKFGELAAGMQFVIEHLQVGCPVPEIEGEDLDGVPFRLSDYKGKVILLDFWGNW